jgi:ParB family transcriptional regulator, chromosome partitioning protein
MPRKTREMPILSAASALIGEATAGFFNEDSQFNHTLEIDLEMVRPDPDQARKLFSEVEIEALAQTMARDGQLQPILVRRDPDVRGGWIIVAGERRWRAAVRSGWKRILAIEHSGDHEIAALLENLQRVDLTVVEEARGVQRLIEGKGWTQAEAAEAIGKPRSDLNGVLRVLELPEDFLGDCLNSDISISRNALVELARVDEGPERDRLIALARAGRLTIHSIRAVRDAQKKTAAPTKKVSSPPGHDEPSGPRRFLFKSLDKVVDRLLELRKAGVSPDEVERALLVNLQNVISDLLGSGAEFARELPSWKAVAGGHLQDNA